MTAPTSPNAPITEEAASSARTLFRRLRDIMQREQVAQSRLDQFVRTIASNMVAEVCTIYLRRAGDELELFAAEGLAREAVHHTRLAWGEGLVGEVARTAQPLNLANAPEDTRFSYRPETREDPYSSFLGVPILRGGRLLGVLTIQNKTPRQYADDEVETLQTIAMILAEIAASGELIDPREFEDVDQVLHRPRRLLGVGLSAGVAIGVAVFHEPPVRASDLFSDDIESERSRLLQAISRLRNSIDEMLTVPDLTAHGEPREILEAYRLFAHDKGWAERLLSAVATGLTAEAAVERVKAENRLRLMRARDPYIRERFRDLDDLAHRLLRCLAEGDDGAPGASSSLPDDAILIARSLGPAELLDYGKEKLRGVILGEGSAASHVAIVARALGLPLVGGAGLALDEVDEGDRIFIDGSNGEIRIRPTSDAAAAYEQKVELQSERQRAYARNRDLPCKTRDGVEIELMLNAGLKLDIPHLEETNAAGIGLFRTELQFMVSHKLPRLRAQRDMYREVIDACGSRPVMFRTVDLGGDKVLPYLRAERERNPAMGWRAIRIALDRPGLLRYQLRAMLDAAAGRDLNLMFPMIAVVDEFTAARDLVEKELARACAMGKTPPRNLRIGTMLEVPSLAFQIDEILEAADFISIGGNDLAQFFFAADRENARMQNRYDVLHPAYLGLLRNLAARCEKAGKPVAYCGEHAGRPIEAMALLGCGIRRLSMSATSIGPVKQMVMSTDLGALEDFLGAAIDGGCEDLRAEIQSFSEKGRVRI